MGFQYGSYLYVILCLILTLYGQIIIKYRIDLYPKINGDLLYTFKKVLLLFLDPYILSGLFSALIASFFWMMALTKISLSRAYPIMASAPIIIVLLSTIFLKEDLTPGKLIGSLLILLGIYLAVKF